MYYVSDLKPHIVVTDKEVECPVQGCTHRVERQRNRFQALAKYQCPHHGIAISPSTFEYPTRADNLLWKGPQHDPVLKEIEKVKRESRMQRDNSEDAVSWNVFRYLDYHEQVGPALESLTGAPATAPETILWSYSPSYSGPWPHLLYARVAFGEANRYAHAVHRGSEPDIIVLAEETLFFIEAKVGASNRTTPSSPNKVRDGYQTGGDGWWDKVFTQAFTSIAEAARRYELARFWLLGTWIANQLGVDFRLVSLVLDGRDKTIENDIRPFLRVSPDHFQRMTWQQIHAFVMGNAPQSADRSLLDEYFKGKSMGYDSQQQLRGLFY